jgi:FxsC-like protein
MPVFFFSYAHQDWDDYLHRFYMDLDELVAARLGIEKTAAGFRDKFHIKLSAEWSRSLSVALWSCKVFIYVRTPRYFHSDYCGREWRIFTNRLEKFSKELNRPYEQPLLMLPLLWLPPEDVDRNPTTVTQDLHYRQYTHAAFPETYSQRGLSSLLRRGPRSQYRSFVEEFVDIILKSIRTWNLVEETSGEEIKHVPSLFKSPSSRSDKPPGEPPRPADSIPPGPRYALCYYIAGKPEELREHRSEVGGYSSYGGAEWFPYYPPPDEDIAFLVQTAAAELKITCIPRFLNEQTGADELARRIAEAQDNNNIVLITIDPWTLLLPRYETIARCCDRIDSYNHAVLIAWHGSDSETAQQIGWLCSKVQNVFTTKTLNGASNYYLYDVKSKELLNHTLVRAIDGARGRIAKFTEWTRPARQEPGTESPYSAGPPILSNS